MSSCATDHLTALGCSLSHFHVSRRVVSLNVRVNCFFYQTLLKLGLCQLTPHWRLIAALGELISSVQVTNVFNQNLEKRRDQQLITGIQFLLAMKSK